MKFLFKGTYENFVNFYQFIRYHIFSGKIITFEVYYIRNFRKSTTETIFERLQFLHIICKSDLKCLRIIL